MPTQRWRVNESKQLILTGSPLARSRADSWRVSPLKKRPALARVRTVLSPRRDLLTPRS